MTLQQVENKLREMGYEGEGVRRMAESIYREYEAPRSDLCPAEYPWVEEAL